MIILRYREISLKGKNRTDFEKALQRNIKSCFEKNGISYKDVLRIRRRILIKTNEKYQQLAKVFGISSFIYSQEYPYFVSRPLIGEE